MSKEFDLNAKIEELEKTEEYFQRPDMDLAQAISRHKDALKLGKEILAYLEEAESQVQEIDVTVTGPGEES